MRGEMSPEPRLLRDEDASSQATHLAATIAHVLAEALRLRPRAGLVVSGGSTPHLMYSKLAQHPLDWARVYITLTDERWVATDDADSNEGRVRSSLIRECASVANFVGLKNQARRPADGAAAAWAGLDAVPRPFDAVLLGMGADGHVASLFPGGAELIQGLDPQAVPGCVAVQPPAASHPRLSLNLAALLQSRHIFVQITGAEKWQTYESARTLGTTRYLPVRAILQQEAVPVDVYWCPDTPTGNAA